MKAAPLRLLSLALFLPAVACERPVSADAEKRFEQELDIAAPKKGDKEKKRSGELVITLNAEGEVSMAGKTLTEEELLKRMQEVAKTDAKRPVIIRADAKTDYAHVVKVMDSLHKAGLHSVSFATAVEEKPERSGEPKERKERTIENRNGTQTTVSFDSRGRARRAVVLDAQSNPLRTIEVGYHRETGRFAEERHYDAEGRLTLRVLAHGTLPNRPELKDTTLGLRYSREEPFAKPAEEPGLPPELPAALLEPVEEQPRSKAQKGTS